MKVLWFSNTPANSDEYLNKQLRGTGGWLKSLDKSIQDKVELNVAFYYKNNIGKFKYGNTHYYPIPEFNNIFGKIKTRLLNSIIDKDHLSIYLNLIDRIQPDIINIHGTENPFCSILSKINIPVVVTIQGNITVCLHKYCSGIESKYLKYTNSKIFDIKTFLFPHSFNTSRNQFKKMQKREEDNLKFCQYNIGRTAWDKRISRVLSPGRKYFHSDEILRDSFYNARWKPTNPKKLIVYTTNGNALYKGFETLCMTLNELNKLGINCEWRVAGIHKSDLIVKVVRKKLKKRFPEKNLTLLGKLDEISLVKTMLEADIYVMPSHIENSPNNLCEAMILGIPCMATFAGGTGSLLTDEHEGLLIQDGDPWAMAGAILELKENYDKAVVMGNNARKRALLRHDKDRIANGLVKIYSDILSSHEVKSGAKNRKRK